MHNPFELYTANSYHFTDDKFMFIVVKQFVPD